jgi:hypothetical protein
MESHLIHYIYISTYRLRFNDSGQYGRTTGSTEVLMNTASHSDIGLTLTLRIVSILSNFKHLF